MGFAVCHEKGRCSILSNRLFRVVSVSFSDAAVLSTPERYLNIPINRANPIIITAIIHRFDFRNSIPNVFVTKKPATESGSTVSLPIIESVSSLIICGYISSKIETSRVAAILKTKR